MEKPVEERTGEDVDRLARKMAKRVISKPPQPQAWPKKPKSSPSPDRVSEMRTHRQVKP